MTVRPTREQLQAAYGKTIRDLIAPDLRVLFIGINPSLYSAAVGHLFVFAARQSLLADALWGRLHRSTSRSRRRETFAGSGLWHHQSGRRGHRAAAELTEHDLQPASGVSRRRSRFRPRWVAFLGISTYQAAWDRSATSVGPQKVRFGGARVWLLPNPSGLNAQLPLPGTRPLVRRPAIANNSGRQKRPRPSGCKVEEKRLSADFADAADFKRRAAGRGPGCAGWNS